MESQKHSPETVIKTSKRTLLILLLGSGVPILYFLLGPYEKTRVMFKTSPMFTIVLGIIFGLLFVYYTSELATRKAEIILSSEGITIRDKGFFGWELVLCFSTLLVRGGESSDHEYMIIDLQHEKSIKFQITDLEKSREELTNLILMYKKENVVYTGHLTK